jgi:CBS domain-containing protein
VPAVHVVVGKGEIVAPKNSGGVRQEDDGPYDLDSRLIHAMAALETALKAKYSRPHRARGSGGRRNEETFGELVQSAIRDGISTEVGAELETLWRIRSVLAHENQAGRPPISATLPGVVRAEQLGEEVLGEPVARLATFCPKPPTVVTTTGDAQLGEVVAMMAEQDFTSVPVVDDEGRCVALLTTQDIAHWLGRHLGRDGIVENTSVAEVMHLAGDDYVFVPRNLPQREARRRFVDHSQRTGAPLMAMLVTMNGSASEPLLGIVTPWDLPYLTPPVFDRALAGADVEKSAAEV